jgi:hypothetical protein
MICLRRFWLRATKVASEPAQRRFIRGFTHYVYAMIDEAFDRASGHIRGIADYFQLRRLTVGGYAFLFPVELGLDIPDEVMEHSTLQSLLSLAIDSIMLANVSLSPNAQTSLTYKVRIYTRIILSRQRDTVATIFSLSS